MPGSTAVHVKNILGVFGDNKLNMNQQCDAPSVWDTLIVLLLHVRGLGITWVLVYRTDKYKRLKAEVEKQSKKLEKKKETITESAGRQQKKKIVGKFSYLTWPSKI
uniref:Uncharacterized protein n=1 Tax=Anolis carolinensis TaxID=28377 RepID=A0A803U1A9_ANOCA